MTGKAFAGLSVLGMMGGRGLGMTAGQKTAKAFAGFPFWK